VPFLSTAVVVYLLAAAAVASLVWMLRGSFLFFSALCLPGTFAHELSHWLTGFLTNAQPTSLSIIPRKNGATYVLGSVFFRNVRWYNGAVVGFSPLLLLPCAYFIAIQRADQLQIIPSAIDVALLYLSAQCLIACIPSTQDIKIAMLNSWWLFLLLAAAALWHHFSGF